MFDHILLAVDGSDHSLKAAKVAGNLARLSGGTPVSYTHLTLPTTPYV